MNETNLVIWLAVTGVGIGGSLICWLMGRTISRLDRDMDEHGKKLDEHSGLHSECKLDLAQFKTEVANTYSKEATTQASLARIHARLDSLPKEIVELVTGRK